MMSSTAVMSQGDVTLAHATGTRPAYFVEQGNGVFRPTPAAAGGGSDGALIGRALAGLAASTLERKYGAPGFVPARLTIDLLKPAHELPTHTQTRLIRRGQRMRTAECDIMQDDWIVARATLLQYRLSQAPAGELWEPESTFTPPRAADDGDVVYLSSESVEWSPVGPQHQNTDRKRGYHRGLDAVAGLAATPFVRAVIVAEAVTHLVTHLGTNGIGYLNGDLTVALARQPGNERLGVRADSRLAADGVSVGNATLFDESGPFGTATVTAVADPNARITFGRN
jgi:hypothetical protein